MRRVCVTGIGVVSPIGIGKERFWKALKEGKSGVKLIDKFDTSEMKSKIAAEVRDFKPMSYFNRKEVRMYDRFTQFAVVAANEAIKDSKVDFKDSKAGVIVGSGIGGVETLENELEKAFKNGWRHVSPYMIPRMIPNMPSAVISERYHIHGPSFCVTSACATSLNAIASGYDFIRNGMLDFAVVGGAEASIVPLAIAAFGNMKALSTRNDEPERASRPFDKNRDGFVMGEGSGILILEELEHAIRRGAKCYCEIKGYGDTTDAYHLVAPEPDGTYATLAMKISMERANIIPKDVDYINAHATGTPVGDIAETRAIKSALGKRAYEIPINSTKSMIGHLLGAAGAVEMIASIMALEEGIVHPTINLENSDSECDLDYVPGKAKKVEVRNFLCNSFGFGGHNVSVLAGKVET
ncbi:MAG: beta-ketoacyl-ACP synthase II [Thermotogae bacterium]|nr:beta-ketoacyl-ACP synthase II [Thermotogota bacterium]